MAARRCPVCLENWPITNRFKCCPECETETAYKVNERAMLPGDAQWRVNNAEFERYYERTRGVPVDHDGDPELDPLRPEVEAAYA